MRPSRDHRYRVAAPWLLSAAFLAAPDPGYAQRARDYVSIVSDATLYPLTATAVDAFGASTRFKYPQIETADAPVGFALFCAGKSLDQPDMILSIRPITDDERLRCIGNGVAQPADITLGFIAVVLVESTAATAIQPTAKELFLAVAAKVPESRGPDAGTTATNLPAGSTIPNAYSTWNELGPEMPARPIRLLLGPPVGAARELFDYLVLLPGCRAQPAFEGVDPPQLRLLCGSVRHDPRIDENHHSEAELSASLSGDPQAIALATFGFLDRNRANLRAVPLNGIVPSAASINDGSYPAARPVHLYIKRDNVALVSGLRDFVDEIAGTKAAGPDGYLIKVGLVPLAEKAAAETRNTIRNVIAPQPRVQRAANPALEEARAAEKARALEAARAAEAERALAAETGRVQEAQRAVEAAQATARDVERSLWEQAAHQSEQAPFQTYLAVFPQGTYAEQARARIAALEPQDNVAGTVLRFEPGQVALSASQDKALAAVVDILRASPDLRLAVEGYSDNTGRPEINQHLALERARNVVARLAAAGIDPNRLVAKGFGADRPVASNDTAEGRARNRRVELRLEPAH